MSTLSRSMSCSVNGDRCGSMSATSGCSSVIPVSTSTRPSGCSMRCTFTGMGPSSVLKSATWRRVMVMKAGGLKVQVLSQPTRGGVGRGCRVLAHSAGPPRLAVGPREVPWRGASQTSVLPIRSDCTVSPSTNSSPGAELLIDLQRDAGVALHRQIESSIRARIHSGALPVGAVLPPTRALALELGISRGVVVEAYEQRSAEGYLTSRSGGYTRVARAATGAPPADASPGRRSTSGRPAEPVVDFGYGRGNFQAFPRAAWLRSFRRVLTETPDARLGYLDGRGAPELRSAIATYLNRVRGTAADADAVVITSGYAQAVSLLLGVLAARGARTVAVEDPSADDDARPVARTLGMEVRGVPVDDGGVRVDALEDLEADVLILTPSHQWPTGGVLSPEARAAVLAWAKRTRALVVEDDYDAEYRYDRSAVSAIHGLDPDQVAYAGTASKTLAPGLRLGWRVLPRELVQPVANAK